MLSSYFYFFKKFYLIEYQFFFLLITPPPTKKKKNLKKKSWLQVVGTVSFTILEFFSFDFVGTLFDESSYEISTDAFNCFWGKWSRYNSLAFYGFSILVLFS